MRCNMDNIYVDLVIEEKEHSRNTEEKSKYVSNQCKDVQSYSTKVMRVTSYKQIFMDERGSKFKRVYLRGKGGLGKTTFCRKVLHAWCNAHEGRAVAQDGYFQDEAVLQIFDLLFFVNLRDVSVDDNLVEAICKNFNFLSPRKNDLETLLYLNGEKILFILDGLDEMIVKAGFIENVVNHRDYPNCCFLVSSRPWKIYQMELQVGIELDLLLDLEGFSENNAVKFAENIFRNCYKDGNATEQFEKDIKDNEVATQLIHVPLLLLFLVHVWYEKRSLPSKLHELYISVLNLMAGQMKANHRQMRFTLGDSRSPFPSKISATSLVVNFGEGFLLSLCEVAHHFLLSSEKENSLVFEETKLLNALGDKGKEKLDVALDLGILSVTDSVSYLNRNTSVSFVHKTMQEFFTALYFILNPDKLANFIASIADLNDVLQNEYIIIFLVGLMPKLGNEVLEKVSELCKGVWETFRSGEGPNLSQRFRLNGISKIYLRCKEEVIGEDVLLNVWGLSLNTNFDLHSWNPPLLQRLDLLRDLRRIPLLVNEKYVNLSGFTGLIYLRLEYLNLSYLPELGSLSVLSMEGVRLSSSCCDVLGSTQCTKLERLKIHTTDLQNCLLDLSNMTELAVLDMFFVTLSSSCCDALGNTLTHCTKLKTLKISNMDLHNCLLHLSNMTELTDLDMSAVALSSSCCDVFGRTLTCCTKLKTLKISNMDLHNCLLHLSNMTELTDLDMSEVALSSSCCDVFGRTLTCCTKLKTLKISNMNLHNCLLHLSNMTELTDLDMNEVTLSSSCCDVFGRTLTCCTTLKTLKISNMDLHNCLLHLSNMTELTDLYMSEVELSSSCCDELGSTLTHCTRLEGLKIYNIDLHNCLLDVSNMTALSNLDLSEVTVSRSCCDVLGSTLTHCAKLETLFIYNTDLHNCQLDLSDMIELSNLMILEVILSSSACQVLELSLDRLKDVKSNFNKYTCEKSPFDNDKWKVNLT